MCRIIGVRFKIPLNITLSIDEKLAEQARKIAQSMGKSLNQLVRDYLEQLTRQNEAQEEIAELRRLSAQGHGHSPPCSFFLGRLDRPRSACQRVRCPL